MIQDYDKDDERFLKRLGFIGTVYSVSFVLFWSAAILFGLYLIFTEASICDFFFCYGGA